MRPVSRGRALESETAARAEPSLRFRFLRSTQRYSGVGSASLAIQLTLETLASMLMRLAINSSFD